MGTKPKCGWLTKQGAGGIAGRSECWVHPQQRRRLVLLAHRLVPCSLTRCVYPALIHCCVPACHQKTGRNDGSLLLHVSRL
jgi:hypothetical protein